MRKGLVGGRTAAMNSFMRRALYSRSVLDSAADIDCIGPDAPDRIADVAWREPAGQH